MAIGWKTINRLNIVGLQLSPHNIAAACPKIAYKNLPFALDAPLTAASSNLPVMKTKDENPQRTCDDRPTESYYTCNC